MGQIHSVTAFVRKEGTAESLSGLCDCGWWARGCESYDALIEKVQDHSSVALVAEVVDLDRLLA